jgi:Asp-tRNA(Asn)/Glu-tRNA(Gln) amidotransferase A subunit family amidase
LHAHTLSRVESGKVKPMLDRREFLARCSAAGLGQTLLPGVLLALASQAAAQTGAQAGTPAMPAISSMPPLTVDMLQAAASVAGLTLTLQQRQMMLEGVQDNRDGITAIRAMHLPNSVAPAVIFDPRPIGFTMPASPANTAQTQTEPDAQNLVGHGDKLAFATVAQLSTLLRTRKITSVELTKLYLARLRRFDGKLHFVITYLDDRALAQAAQADRDIEAGNYKGPLHGIPWGAKDLLAVKGYPTTWGAAGFEQQHFDEDATVVQRLDAAGAVLIAKLTLGALAQGDVWFGGRTRNPWNPSQGSSGSSAGSASAVSAGCVGFAIGSETLGSISSPSTRCGVTGFRPTFGFVPRTGAMALSWSMDKLGPLTRSAADAALVLAAIHGPDGHDLAVHQAPFVATPLNLKTLRVGYLESAFAMPAAHPPEASPAKPEAEALSPAKQEEQRQQRQLSLDRRIYDNRYDQATLTSLRSLGITPVPVKLPDLPFGSISPLLVVEAAAAFDDLLRSGRDALLTAQGPEDWPNQFRIARLYSGVDYVQAMRARSVLIQQMAELFQTIDILVTPSGGAQLVATNLSGHPACIVPNGLRGTDAPAPPHTDDGDDDNIGGPGTPVSITFLGGLYDDARLLAFAEFYQARTPFHLLHPPQFA